MEKPLLLPGFVVPQDAGGEGGGEDAPPDDVADPLLVHLVDVVTFLDFEVLAFFTRCGCPRQHEESLVDPGRREHDDGEHDGDQDESLEGTRFF